MKNWQAARQERPSWAKIKRSQARDADRLAAVASGIGEYGIANACYRLAGILRRHAEAELEAEKSQARRRDRRRYR